MKTPVSHSKVIPFPVSGLSKNMIQIIKWNLKDHSLVNRICFLETTIMSRGKIIGRDANGNPIDMVQITLDELNWLKEIYEEVI